MKKNAWILGTVLILTCAGALVAQQSSTKADSNPLGTWELVSTKYGDAKAFEDYTKERKRVRMITATHFLWVDYDTKTKKVSASAGGPYTYHDGSYIETIDFAGEGMETYVGKKQEFTIRIDGDKFFQSGQLSDGLKIEEVWQRVK
jgi:hypothetical protein